jgi:hypothetical protein
VQTKFSLGTANTPQWQIDRFIKDAETWIKKVQFDAGRHGIANPVIRYVVPDKNSLPQQVIDYLESIDLNILVEAPLSGT